MNEPRSAPKRLAWSGGLFMATLLVIGTVMAQPLAALAPADSIVTLSHSAQDRGLGSLGADLAALDWSKLGGLLEAATAAFGERPFNDFTDAMQLFEEFDTAFDDLDSLCPGLGTMVSDPALLDLVDDALLTVSLSPFNPLPAITGFVRVNPELADTAAELQDTLVACFSDATMTQNGVPMFVLGDGSDQPLVLSSVGDVYLVGTNPEVVRAAIRLSTGSDAGSLLDTNLWQASSRLAAEGLGFSVSFEALADVLQNAAGMAGNATDTEALVARGLGTLRTIGGIAGRISLQDDGLLLESIAAVNPEGGDPQLAELLLCERCTVSRPFVAPAEVTAVSSQYLPLRELVRYLQSWLDDIGPAVGEDLDIRELLRREFGFDLDVALLNWIGTEVHTVTLEPFSPNLRSLLYQPATAYIIPVSSPEQARAGLDLMGERMLPILAGIFETMDGGNFGSLPFDMGALDSILSVRETSYSGVHIQRIQANFNLDIGIAFVGNNMVIGMPARAVEPLIDTYQGARTVLSNRAYRAAVAAAPDAVSSLTYADVATNLHGLYDLLDLAVQPLAAGVFAAFKGATSSVGFDSGFQQDLGFADLFGIEAQPLAAIGRSGVVADDLGSEDVNNFGEYSDYYRLQDLNPGDTVTMVVTSDLVDTYLYLVDADSELYLDSNDDAPDTSRSELTFVVQAGIDYWIEVSSFGGTEEGPYRLTVTSEAGDPTMAAITPPTFGELLEILELFPQAVAVLADHIDRTEGYSHVDGTVLYMRSMTYIRW